MLFSQWTPCLSGEIPVNYGRAVIMNWGQATCNNFAVSTVSYNVLYFVAVTHQMVLPTSSATNSAPRLSMTTPTGRPITLPSDLMKPVKTSNGSPDGIPAVNDTKMTL